MLPKKTIKFGQSDMPSPPPPQHTKLIYTSQLYGALGEDFSEESYESINQNLAELVSDEKKP
jgi:hypothetical protein